ncbi:MAG: response regulator transcription factor [Chromatiales bacterium]
MSAVVKVLIADDHELVRKGLRQSLAQLPYDVDVLEASNAREVLDAVEAQSDLSLIVLDLRMPDTQGMGLLRHLCNELPEVPVVVLSAAEDRDSIRKTIDLGASGFIPKSAASEVMLKAVDLVLAGGIYLPPAIFRAPGAAEWLDRDLDEESEGLRQRVEETLTSRQLDVLGLLGRGASNKEIARELQLSENTVKIHVAAILRGLKVSNRTQAGVVAQKIGLH